MKRFAALAAAAVVAVAFCALNAETPKPSPTSKPTAEEAKALAVKATALLNNKCVGCHGHGFKGTDGKLVGWGTDVPRLIKQNLIVPGKPEQSRLAKYVVQHPGKLGAKAPTQEEAKAFVAWIAAGAVDPNAPAATPKPTHK